MATSPTRLAAQRVLWLTLGVLATLTAAVLADRSGTGVAPLSCWAVIILGPIVGVALLVRATTRRHLWRHIAIASGLAVAGGVAWIVLLACLGTLVGSSSWEFYAIALLLGPPLGVLTAGVALTTGADRHRE